MPSITLVGGHNGVVLVRMSVNEGGIFGDERLLGALSAEVKGSNS